MCVFRVTALRESPLLCVHDCVNQFSLLIYVYIILYSAHSQCVVINPVHIMNCSLQFICHLIKHINLLNNILKLYLNTCRAFRSDMNSCIYRVV